MSSFRRACVVAALAFAFGSACSNSNNPSGNSYFTWNVEGDGADYAADPTLIQVTPGAVVPGSVVITGTKVSGTNTHSVSLFLGFIGGKATYPMGVNQASTPGGTANRQITTSSPVSVSNWTVPFNGNSGSVTITDISSSKITGTFDFFADPQPGSSATTKTHVRNGKFSVPLSGFTVAPASDPGSTLTVDAIAGTKFVGATVVGIGSPASFSFGATNNVGATEVSAVSILNVVAVTAGSSYTVLTGIRVTVTIGSTGYGGVAGDTGTVVIDSISGKYLKGHFDSLTLKTAAGAAIVLTGGHFNVKLPG